MSAPLFVLDLTCGLTHRAIKGRACGASEYQFYCLLEQLAKQTPVWCFHARRDTPSPMEGVQYFPANHLVQAVATASTPPTVLVQRFLPDVLTSPLARTLSQLPRVLVWCHDQEPDSLLRHFGNVTTDPRCHEALAQWRGLELVLVSHALRERVQNYAQAHPLFAHLLRRPMHVMHNALYEEELGPAPLAKHSLVFASAWNKGIHAIVELFAALLKKDPTLTLELLTPGYGHDTFQAYSDALQVRFGERVIVHGPKQKKEMASILANALVVLTAPFWETFGCVFAEALHLGTPVLVNHACGAVQEIVPSSVVVNYQDVEGTWRVIRDIQRWRSPTLPATLRAPFMVSLWEALLTAESPSLANANIQTLRLAMGDAK